MRISVELVPRGEAELCSELTEIRAQLSRVDTINIPDLLRFPLRSWQGCRVARDYIPQVIPHIRAIDIPLDKPLEVAPFLRESGITEVLVVTGDAPPDMSRLVYPSSSLDVIRKFRREMPEVTVYAAVDPYRKSFREEHDYALRKLDAGAEGFFTQPFFDLRLLEIYAELLEGLTVFWGFTSVTSERSLSYWKTRNKVVFPADFAPKLAWNRSLAQEALRVVEDLGGNIYFMPIRLSAIKYLQGIL